MKKNHHKWASPVTGALLCATAASAQQDQQGYLHWDPFARVIRQDQQVYLDSTNRVTLSMRFGLNIHAKFTGIGSTAGNGYYDDGYVLKDSTDNYLGYTSYWGYNNANQYSQAANTFSFHKPSTTGIPSEISDSDNPYLGVELTYDRQLGVKEDWHHMRYGVEGAVNYMKISMNNNSSYNAAVTTDTYPFGGIAGQQPLPGYQGSFSGNPGDPVLVASGNPTTTPGGTLQAQDNFDADLWGFRLGPYVEFPLSDKFNLHLSGGLAVGLLNGNGSWQEKLTLPLSLGGSTITTSGSGNDFNALWGFYAGANADYQFSEHWGIAAGVQFQDLGTYDHNFGGRGVELDLSKSVFITIGLGYSF